MNEQPRIVELAIVIDYAATKSLGLKSGQPPASVSSFDSNCDAPKPYLPASRS